jgi:outer membrane lipoprotein SlyB
MSKINSVAFMHGYMQKSALDAAPLTPEQIKQLGGKGSAGEKQYNEALKANKMNQFLSSQNVQDYGSTGVGAAAGGALGGIMGGDATSALMGTALGGIVGWLTKYFFPEQMDKAHQYALDQIAKGTLGKTMASLEKKNAEAKRASDALNLQGSVKKAEADVKEKNAKNNIGTPTNTDSDVDMTKLEDDLKFITENKKHEQEVDPDNEYFPKPPTPTTAPVVQTHEQKVDPNNEYFPKPPTTADTGDVLGKPQVSKQ